MRLNHLAVLVASCLVAALGSCSRTAPQPAAPNGAAAPQKGVQNPAEAPADATKDAVIVGDLQVRITGARIGKARVKQAFTDGEFPQKDDDLIIYLHVKNLSATKKIFHKGWAMTAFGDSIPRLSDEFGTTYQHHLSVAAFVDGVQVYVGNINPGQEVNDIVLFQVPAANATRLNVELPAPRDNPGTFRFLIPMSMVKRDTP